MSRHTISDSKNPNYYWVIGYDRPLNEFFYQKWGAKTGALLASGAIECELSECRDAGMVIPDELQLLLVKEACGQSDTQACKDWRVS